MCVHKRNLALRIDASDYYITIICSYSRSGDSLSDRSGILFGLLLTSETYGLLCTILYVVHIFFVSFTHHTFLQNCGGCSLELAHIHALLLFELGGYVVLFSQLCQHCLCRFRALKTP